jgi:hypothetical protein
MMNTRRLAPATSILALALVLGACSASGGAAATGSPLAASPVASSSSAVGASPTGGDWVTTPEAAAELVLGQDPRFAGFGPQDPDMIGQCCWYEVTQAASGWNVLVHAGWGDCPSGCINKHEWTYSVSQTGEVELTGETGDPVPAGELPAG